MQPIKSILTFDGYRISEAILSFNNVEKERSQLKTDLKSSIQMSDEGNITSSLIIDINSLNDSIKIHVCIVGDFTITTMDELTEDQISFFAKQSTVTILFPYLRSFISTITLQAGIPAINLPVINVVEALKDDKNH